MSKVTDGGTASIYKALDHETETIICLKIFKSAGRDPAIVNEIWNRECSALSQLTHDGIVKFLDAGRAGDTDERWIAIQWVDGTTLESHLRDVGRVTWEQFLDRYGHQILEALVFAAQRNVAHRDLSTSNILVAPNGRLTIIDFGQAKMSSIGIGLTVRDFRTVPYCPPEDDTGRHTLTRDPYAFCAVAVRALAGRPLQNHDELYEDLARVDIPLPARDTVARALSRIPEDRGRTIVEFADALRAPAEAEDAALPPPIAVRLAPSVHEKIALDNEQREVAAQPLDSLLDELNDVVFVSPAAADAEGRSERIKIETRYYRLIALPDSSSGDHLVVVDAIRKHLRIDTHYRSDRWTPHVRFIGKLPRTPDEKRAARQAWQGLYEGLDAHLDERRRAERNSPEGTISSWESLLEALRFLAKNSTPPLHYTNLEKAGRRLIAAITNPDDAAEEEFRVISVDGSWVFRGEVESVRDGRCVLVSTRTNFDLDRLPAHGVLDFDWLQTRTALDRQAHAVEAFKQNTTPAPRLRGILLGNDAGPVEPTFANVPTFLDGKLDAAKKAVVSRFMSGTELLVTHGPPGTGKTKLIVELIRQAVRSNPECRILLASQTHVALDNALERILVADPSVTCVRIGSGSKEADVRVASSSLDQRSLALREHVSKSAQHFIEDRATQQGVDLQEVRLGLAVLEIVGKTSELDRTEAAKAERWREIEDLRALLEAEGHSTSDRTQHGARARVLEDEHDQLASDLVSLRAEIDAARKRLSRLGTQGSSLAALTVEELDEWSQVLLHDDKRRALGELMKLSEQWRLRFGQSDDFKSAIIASSNVVAGTCVGFCREAAALRTVFDLCIIDEAGKATTTELLVPLAQSRRAVLLGDHLQLPAVLDHALASSEIMRRFGLRNEQIKEQLFERLSKDLAEGGKADLNIQYRMRGEIGRLVSECFYDGLLNGDESLQSREVPDLTLCGLDAAVTWLDPYSASTVTFEEVPRGTSFENPLEARAIVALLKRIALILEQRRPRAAYPTIGVISGYAPQVSKIKQEIRRETSLDALNVECASVHSFQGREVDICIYSVTRKNPLRKVGMLKDWRHLNVALSRARNFLVIVGCREFCRSLDPASRFGRVLSFVEDSPACALREWTDD